MSRLPGAVLATLALIAFVASASANASARSGAHVGGGHIGGGRVGGFAYHQFYHGYHTYYRVGPPLGFRGPLLPGYVGYSPYDYGYGPYYPYGSGCVIDTPYGPILRCSLY